MTLLWSNEMLFKCLNFTILLPKNLPFEKKITNTVRSITKSHAASYFKIANYCKILPLVILYYNILSN